MHEKEIGVLQALKRCMIAMKFGLEDMHNLACAKAAVDLIDKVLKEYQEEEQREKQSEDVTEHGDG